MDLRSLENGWDYGVSEQPLTDRFLRHRHLPAICHPGEGGSTATASRVKQSADGGRGRFFIGPFPARPKNAGLAQTTYGTRQLPGRFVPTQTTFSPTVCLATGGQRIPGGGPMRHGHQRC